MIGSLMPMEFPNLVVILVEPEQPGNVGFVTRVLANFGVQELRIVGWDPREDMIAQIYSVRAHEILDSAVIYDDLSSALEEIDAAWATSARAGRNHSVTRALVPLENLPDPTALEGKVALVFGRESSGLTNEELALCDFAFTISTSEGYPSLNLSHAVAIVLHHIFTHYAPEEPREITFPRAATRAERNQVMVFLDEVIDSLNLKDYRKPIAKQVFRNLLGRSYMTGREVTTMTGVARKLNDLVKDDD
ncbi:TrmJ/YjtD family RNA methyltransferase [Candidatus Thorarchaeota archaeon]|nr:MAG: TrmJ/YjtD family RNA methyltransferase [Candidatus Thorarchaeota archaeon]